MRVGSPGRDFRRGGGRSRSRLGRLVKRQGNRHGLDQPLRRRLSVGGGHFHRHAPEATRDRPVDTLSEDGFWYAQDAYDKALADFLEAIRLDPKAGRVWSDLGLTWALKNEPANAAANFQQAIRLDPKDPQICIDEGIAYLNQGKSDEAVAAFDRALALDPRSPDAHRGRGLARLAQGSPEAAIVDFDQAIALDRRNAGAYKGRGMARLSQHNLEAAITDFNEAIRLNPRDAECLQQSRHRGPCHRDEDKALSDLSEAIQNDPNGGAALQQPCLLLARQGAVRQDAFRLNEAIRFKPKKANSYVGRGLAWFMPRGNMTGRFPSTRGAEARSEQRSRLPLSRRMPSGQKGNTTKPSPTTSNRFSSRRRATTRESPTRTAGSRDKPRENTTKRYPIMIRLFRPTGRQFNTTRTTPAGTCVAGTRTAPKPISPKRPRTTTMQSRCDARSAVARNARAWFAATCAEAKYRDGTKAVQDATRACELTSWNDIEFLSTLAAAYAERGDFSSTITWQEKAIAIASQQQKPKLSGRLELFRAHKPYRQ